MSGLFNCLSFICRIEKLPNMLPKDKIGALVGMIAGLVFVFGIGVGIKLYDATSPTSDTDNESSTLPIETSTLET